MISEYIIEKFRLEPSRESPFLIPASRWTLFPEIFNGAGFKIGAEVGVGGGRFARRLLESVVGLRLVAVDPWVVYPYYEGRYTQDSLERNYRKCLERLRFFECKVVREFSAQAVTHFRDEGFDFVHIDANRTFKDVTEDLTLWWPKIRKGGVLCGTCYYDERNPSIGQVKKAVDAWTLTHGIDPWFVAVHARYPAWFWEKR